MTVLNVKPGDRFEVPVGSDLPIKFGTPYTAQQLLDAQAAGGLAVIWTHDGDTGQWDAVPEDTGILLNIPSDRLEVGFYALKPRAVIDGKVKKYKKAVAMHVLADGDVYGIGTPS